MGRYISLIFCALALMVSCSKPAGEAPEMKGEPIRLVVGVNGSAGTRAVDMTAANYDVTEGKVNSLQVFVFFAGGGLDGYGSSVNSLSATVNCTSGAREIYAVVNAPDLSGVVTKTALLATVSNLGTTLNNFEMIGSTSETLVTDGAVNIDVYRLAARVVIRGIKNALENAAQAAAFTLDAVYLTNAVGDVNYGISNTYAPTVWYNRRGYEAANNRGSLTNDTVGAAIAASATNGDAHFFYSYPNLYPVATGIPAGYSAFTPRGAKLVVQATIAGTKYDFPIELPALQNNKSYEINLLTLTRTGNPDDGSHDPDDPDDTDEEKPITADNQSFTITVKPWNVELLGDSNGNITI